MKQTDCSSSDSCSAKSVITDASRAACDAENLPYDPQLSSFPAVKENVSVRETRKPRNRTNASHILKDQGSSGSADSDPSVPCRDQEEIPTFEEWTKIMMEVENEKSQITHVSNGLTRRREEASADLHQLRLCGVWSQDPVLQPRGQGTPT
ncbi:hypothetical protein QQF64_014265 [Cirrhinus molitorella]|uniref:Uncharacterized protein n=1 Tax=Cirrhinus molitorella TaxID=172907 RepID=A0ABR3NRZ9_9TELE